MVSQLDEVTLKLRKLIRSGVSIDDAKALLISKGYADELITGAMVQSQVKHASKLLKHRKKAHNIVRHSSSFSLIIIIVLTIITFVQQDNVSQSIILATAIMMKLFSISMIFNSLVRIEIGWTIALIGTMFFPGLDIIGACWYYLVEVLRKKSPGSLN